MEEKAQQLTSANSLLERKIRAEQLEKQLNSSSMSGLNVPSRLSKAFSGNSP